MGDVRDGGTARMTVWGGGGGRAGRAPRPWRLRRACTTVAVVGALCVVTSLTVGGGAGATRPETSTSPRPAPSGLSKSLYAALAKAGTFTNHPLKLLILGDSIALTLGIGLSKKVKSRYGLHISNHASLGCDLDPQLQVMTEGKPGPATLGV